MPLARTPFQGLVKTDSPPAAGCREKKGDGGKQAGVKAAASQHALLPRAQRCCQCLRTAALYCFTALELKPNPAALDLPGFDINQHRDGSWASEQRLRAASVPLEQEGDGITAGPAQRDPVRAGGHRQQQGERLNTKTGLLPTGQDLQRQ